MELKDVNQKFKELNEYFRDKIVAGKYKVLDRGQHIYKIRIDGKFNFALWIGNGEKHLATTDGYSLINSMKIKFRVSDQNKAWEIIKQDIAETLDKEKEENERKELARLKAKFES